MKNHGIKYAVASNGQEAFDKWSQGAFHLILVRIRTDSTAEGIHKAQRAIGEKQRWKSFY